MLRYAKAIVAFAVPLLSYFLELADDGLVTGDEWRLLLVAAITAGTVYLVPNKQSDQ